MIAVIVIVEAAAQLASSQIQVGALVFNQATGVIVGVLTAIVLFVLVTNEFIAAATV